VTLGGERQDRPEDAKAYHRQERGRGSFVRTFGLPFQVDPDKVEAKLRDGILTLSLQRPEHDKPKRIRVSA
jgi:HSP20 family protein